MRTFIPIRYLIPLTHLAVFFFTAAFVGFSTYTLTKEYFEREFFPAALPQISEQVRAEGKQEYVVYEAHQTLETRPNGMNKEKVTGYAANDKGETHIIYSFVDDPRLRKFQKTAPTPTLLSNGKIFLNGVSDRGFAILDLAGNNVTANYGILQNRDFPLSNILFKSEKEIFTTYGGPNSKEKDGRHLIYWRQEKKPTVTIDASTFPSGNFWLKPLGWSSKKQEFYVERESSTLTYAQIWRVSAAAKTAQPIESMKGAVTASVRVCSEEDYAVSIASALDPTEGSYGAQIGPSRLIVTNLTVDTSRTIFSSPKLLTDLFVSCASRKILVQEKDEYRLFDTSGASYRISSFAGQPIVFAADGKSVVAMQENMPVLAALDTGVRTPLGKKTDAPKDANVRYTVLGISYY